MYPVVGQNSGRIEMYQDSFSQIYEVYIHEIK